MVLQAWGAYGTAWPVVHQQLGVRPDIGRGCLEVVPQVPERPDARRRPDIRLGDAGAAAVERLAAGSAHDHGAGGRAGHEARDRAHAARRREGGARRARRRAR